MRIALVVHDYHRKAGHARYVAELATRFQREHEVHVFSNTFEQPEPHHIVHHPVPSWRGNALASILTFILPVSRLIARHGPFDIVHAQGLCGLSQDVVTAHITQAGWFAAVDRVGQPQSLRKRLFRAIVSPLEARVYRERSAKAFIAVSRRVQEDLKKYHGLEGQVCMIHHGVDTVTFQPDNRRVDRAEIRDSIAVADNQFMLLYVGDWQKVSHVLWQVLELIPNVVLTVVTRTSATEIGAEAIRRGLTTRLKVVSETNHIARYYAAADAFIFPSYYDTFGMVVAEAMASGLPVIVSRDAGASEWIDEGRNGMIVEDSNDAKGFATAVQRLMDFPEWRLTMGKEARETCLEHTWDRVAERTLQVYRSVVTPSA